MSVCAYRAAEVEFLASMGASPVTIAQQLDVKADTLARSLYRAGRGDLARMFSPIIERERQHPCADCPTIVSRTSKRCRPCGTRHHYSQLAT